MPAPLERCAALRTTAPGLCAWPCVSRLRASRRCSFFRRFDVELCRAIGTSVVVRLGYGAVVADETFVCIGCMETFAHGEPIVVNGLYFHSDACREEWEVEDAKETRRHWIFWI